MNVKKTTIFFLFMVFAFFSNNTFAETIRLDDSPSQEIKAQQQVQPLSSLKRKDTATYDDTYRLAYLKDKNPSEKIMGITRLQWETELSKFKDFELDKDFVDIVKKTEKAIDSRWGTEYFQRINGEKTVKEYQRNNPLLAYKKRRNISKFFANIDLSQQEFNYMLNFIPTLKGVYSDEEIAILVPYIAFAETHDISRGRIRVLVKRALDKGTPVDVITDRLFRTVLEEFQYKD
jgi:hypothetical protein